MNGSRRDPGSSRPKREGSACSDLGFSLIELSVVVVIIGILVAIAVPIFSATKASAQTKSCFANQRTIEGIAQTYKAVTGALPPQGVIDPSHPIVTGPYLKRAPTCPYSGNWYSIDNGGTVVVPTGCPHGHY